MAIASKENSIKVLRHLKKEAELSDSMVIAIMANIAVETGYTFDYKIKQRGKRTDPAYGLFQFDPRGSGMAKLYQLYLEYRNIEDSMEAQLDLIVDILTKTWATGVSYIGGGNVDKMLEAAKIGPAPATEAFCLRLLRPGVPHMDRRLQAVAMVESLMRETFPA